MAALATVVFFAYFLGVLSEMFTKENANQFSNDITHISKNICHDGVARLLCGVWTSWIVRDFVEWQRGANAVVFVCFPFSSFSIRYSSPSSSSFFLKRSTRFFCTHGVVEMANPTRKGKANRAILAKAKASAPTLATSSAFCQSGQAPVA